MTDALARSARAFVLSRLGSRKLVSLLARSNKADLTVMREFMLTGKVTPVVDRRYRISEIRDVIRYMEEGHARGKVIITLDDNDKT